MSEPPRTDAPRRRRRASVPFPKFRTSPRNAVRRPDAVPVWDGRMVPRWVRTPVAPSAAAIVHRARRDARKLERAQQGTRRERIAELRLEFPGAGKAELARIDRQRRRARAAA